MIENQIEEDLEETPVYTCPICARENQSIGSLGSTEWYQCRDCGFEYANTETRTA